MYQNWDINTGLSDLRINYSKSVAGKQQNWKSVKIMVCKTQIGIWFLKIMSYIKINRLELKQYQYLCFHIVTKLMENYIHDQKHKLHLAEWRVVGWMQMSLTLQSAYWRTQCQQKCGVPHRIEKTFPLALDKNKLSTRDEASAIK